MSLSAGQLGLSTWWLGAPREEQWKLASPEGLGLELAPGHFQHILLV